MKIAVTGAYGQLGNEINELSQNYKNWDFLFTDVDSLDITNEKAVKEFYAQNQPDFIVNCAAYTAVDKAESDIETARRVNAQAPEILAKVSAGFHSKLIQVSTDYVFDGKNHEPYLETDPVGPTGIYGQTKLEGEQLSLQANPQSIVIRTSWLYSSFGNNFVKTMLRLGSEREELKVVFDQVGTPTYAADLAATILKIIELSENDATNFVPGIYHFSNEGVASWFDFAQAILTMSNINCKVFPVLSNEFPTPATRPNYSVLDKTKIKNTFAIEIPYWTESLGKCVKKLKKN